MSHKKRAPACFTIRLAQIAYACARLWKVSIFLRQFEIRCRRCLAQSLACDLQRINQRSQTSIKSFSKHMGAPQGELQGSLRMPDKELGGGAIKLVWLQTGCPQKPVIAIALPVVGQDR